jgi:aryl-alcohol dehydrogenase-like predicted oxidoreductase
MLDEVYSSGVTFWDTADLYSVSESVIGKWCVFSTGLLLPDTKVRV